MKYNASSNLYSPDASTGKARLRELTYATTGRARLRELTYATTGKARLRELTVHENGLEYFFIEPFSETLLENFEKLMVFSKFKNGLEVFHFPKTYSSVCFF